MGKRKRKARTAAVLAMAAAVVCLTAFGGWMVWRELGHSARAESSQAENVQTENLQTENRQPENTQPDTVIELTTAAGPETASEKSGAEAGNAAGNAAGAQDSGEDTDTSGQTGEESGDITLLFAGDVYFSDHVMNAYNQAGGIGGVLDAGIRADIGAADIFMVNQEFPFTNRGTAAEDKQFTFRIPPEKVSMLTEMGVDIVTMANNHILDFGPEGITDSLAALDGAGKSG